ncbi:uncharacterized protein (DUF302 family) [Gillisia mitskevichiae]|uniref:Uncharacterized protein (DUF302 family) n=1 Tax=Gillisia mitskevichiae TaxID=270921 RepID=A0A495Q068_9FLAO|nr:DUF302 domain-containing protein [Gillisia mitskevichiae]RKS56104.1 uncharacterized protein (DUF302 family) [Gillisia mitskevichiae]
MIKFISLFSFLFILNSCNDDDPGDVVLSSEEINITGTKYSESKNNFTNTYAIFIDSLNANNAISIVAEVDHAANARTTGRVVNPTKIVFFGNPLLGTPLMQKNQLAGLDLPQKVLFFQNSDNTVYAIFNSVSYLETRHGLQGVNTLPQISTALGNLTKAATSSEIKRATDLSVEFKEGIITVKSTQDFESTYSALENAIASNENLSIVAQLDHQLNAASVGLELRPTKIIIFGNPNLGSPLMQNKQSIGLDLPQKILVWESEDGTVNISYNDPYYLASRHLIEENDEVLEQISTALSNLAEIATGN